MRHNRVISKVRQQQLVVRKNRFRAHMREERLRDGVYATESSRRMGRVVLCALAVFLLAVGFWTYA